MDCQLLLEAKILYEINELEEDNGKLKEIETQSKRLKQRCTQLEALLKEENQKLKESKMQLKMLEQRRIQLKTMLKAENRKRKEIETQGKMLEQSGQRPAQMSCSTCEGSCLAIESNKCGRCPNSLCLNCQLTGFREGSYIQWCIGCEKVMCPACTRKGFICRRCTCFICEVCSKCSCNQNIYDPNNL